MSEIADFTPTASETGKSRHMRGPLRPSHLVSTRRRVHPAIASWTFRSLDAAALAAWSSICLTRLDISGAACTPFLIQPLLVWGVLLAVGAYSHPKGERLRAQISMVVMVFAAVTFCAAPLLAGGVGWPLAIRWTTTWGTPALIGLVIAHSLWWGQVRRWRAMDFFTPNIIVVGATATTEKLVRELLACREANVLGVFDDRSARRPPHVLGVPVLGTTEDLIGHRTVPFADRIIIAVPSQATARVAELVQRLSVLPNEIQLVLDGEDAKARARLGQLSLTRLAGLAHDPVRAAFKRMQDLVVASLALLALSPVLIIVALAVVMDSPGPVFFRQRRHGFNNEEILVWKFRSMRVECSDATASRQVSANDDRVTRVGRFIRRTSLDELPQLFNVIKGEMSLVGPRPHAIGMKTQDMEASRLVDTYAHRHRLKPGLTGWAAIHGSRGPVDDPDSLKHRIALDLEYVERQSFWLDLWIMLRTVPCLLGDDTVVR